MRPAINQVDRYVAEATDRLAARLDKANGIRANLQLAIEGSKARTILAGYDFAPNQAALPQAWEAAICGDCSTMLATGAAIPDVGRGLEKDNNGRQPAP
jgi:hypothetical protein